MSSLACLDMSVAGERFNARACIDEPGCMLPFCPAVRAREMFSFERTDDYIAIEIRKPLEACATIWPVVEAEPAVRRGAGKAWRHSFAGGLLSAFLHCTAAALVIGFLPATLALPAGSEAPIMVETIDEASFAALQEGTARGADIPDLPLPEAVDPSIVKEALAREAVNHVVPAPEADTALSGLSPELTLPMPRPTENEKPPEQVERKEIPPPKPKPRQQKKMAVKGSEAGSNAAGRQAGGADAVSTASAARGKASRTEGMGGMAAGANLRSKVIAHLGRHKRYPDVALSMRLEGSVGITFSIGADGSLKSASVNRSSGHGLLDREALAMLRRAQPFPIQDAGQAITITTQIGYIYPR